METLNLKEKLGMIERQLMKTTDDVKRIRAQLGVVSRPPPRKEVLRQQEAIREKQAKRREEMVGNPAWKEVWGPDGKRFVPRRKGASVPIQTLDDLNKEGS